MTYAGTRRILDADSHLMEFPDFLTANADPAWRDRLPSLGGLDEVTGLADLEVGADGERAHPAEVARELAAYGDALLRGPKWYGALGSFNAGERSTALDLLGFERQLVFSSFAGGELFAHADLDAVYAGIRAHNRGMAAFCQGDERLIGVGLVALDDVPRAIAEVDASLESGLGCFWLPSRAPGGRSPGHPAHDPFWARLQEARVPFVLHVGSSSIQIGDAWMNDGMPERASARGGAEVIGSKDLAVIYQSAERFLSVLILDGVLERFPGLRGGCIELGAEWVPAMLRRLDHAVRIWARSEPHLAEMQRLPSEQARAQLRFTPYPFEDVGRLIRESNDALYLFSSDYPHAEGGRDPLGRFEAVLAGATQETRDRFYARNFLTLFE